MIDPSIFRPYNVRGIYPGELNEEVAYLLAQAFARVTKTHKVAVGRDARLSGPALQKAVMYGLIDMDVDVIDLGMITTDELYFVAAKKDMDGIQVSASHNPSEWNGLKFILKGVKTLTDDQLQRVYREAQKEEKHVETSRGEMASYDAAPEYLEFLMNFVDPEKLRPFRVVINPLNGTVGPAIQALAKRLPLTIVPLNMEPDGSFPKGPPDPLLPAMRRETSEATKREKVDFGVSWDNDGDRVFFFDDTGEYVQGPFTTALLAKFFLERTPKAKIISETRVLWPVKETIEAAGGIHIINKPGHVFLKARMREEDAVFGGELSGHYFFRDFWYADNGFIPFLLMLEILSDSGKKLSELLASYRAKYFFSDEMNFPLAKREDAVKIFERVELKYTQGEVDRISGITLTFPDWRFNLRPSDNEPLIRLNVEARKKELLNDKVKEVGALIESALR